jgi:FtsH-binding integral membrane protein
MSIIGIFVGSESYFIGIAIATVVIFIGFIAFDVQKIKNMYETNMIPEENLAIYGALQLYLDFINIFIELLRIFGRDN